MQNLQSKITNLTAKIGIIGLGYVGLPLALAFAKKFTVYGYDISTKTIEGLRAGKSHISLYHSPLPAALRRKQKQRWN